MPRVQISLGDELHAELTRISDASGSSLSSTVNVLLYLAVRSKLGPAEEEQEQLRDGLDRVIAARPKRQKKEAPPADDEKSADIVSTQVIPSAVSRPHQRRDRPALQCKSRDLVDGVCPTCGYRAP